MVWDGLRRGEVLASGLFLMAIREGDRVVDLVR